MKIITVTTTINKNWQSKDGVGWLGIAEQSSIIGSGVGGSPPATTAPVETTVAATETTDEPETSAERGTRMTVRVGGVCVDRPTLRASFSAVSLPVFAANNFFLSLFRDLQDSHSFAQLQTSR